MGPINYGGTPGPQGPRDSIVVHPQRVIYPNLTSNVWPLFSVPIGICTIHLVTGSFSGGTVTGDNIVMVRVALSPLERRRITATAGSTAQTTKKLEELLFRLGRCKACLNEFR
jgi:hypothetical protein